MKPWFKLAAVALASVLAQPVLGQAVLGQPVLGQAVLGQPVLGQAGSAPGGSVQGGSAQDMAAGMAPDGSSGGAALMAAMAKMSTDMANVPLSGNPDRDFVAMMLPHHEGAVAMANYELAHGKDPAMLALARAIVTAQETEIGEMKAWQAAHPPAP